MNNGFVKSASARTIDVNFFIEYDEDGNGSLDIAEIKKIATKVLGCL